MQLPNTQRNLITNFICGQVDLGATPGKLNCYSDETKVSLHLVIILNNPAYTGSNTQGNAGTILQPQIMGRSWIDTITTQLIGIPLLAGIVTYGEIVDSNDDIKQIGFITENIGSFIQLSDVDLIPSTPVQILNGFFETLPGNK